MVGERMKGTAVGEVVVVIGTGSIGQAIARRVSAGKHVSWLTYV
jgi:lactate dehydrogenase-like 2-hydroxyacid dehydrogenase